MSQITSTKPRLYDLEDRTLRFAQMVKKYVNSLPKSISNIEYGKQLVRSSGSVGANYIEANECLSKKDFVMRLRIAKKETKESRYWLQLAEPSNVLARDREALLRETVELMKIFGAILEKTK